MTTVIHVSNILLTHLRGVIVWALCMGSLSAVAIADNDVSGSGDNATEGIGRIVNGYVYDAFDNHLFEELSMELVIGGIDDGTYDLELLTNPYLLDCPAVNGKCYIQTLDAWEQGYEDLAFGTYAPAFRAIRRDMPLTPLGQPLPLLQDDIVNNRLQITYPFSPQGRYIRLYHPTIPAAGYLITDMLTEYGTVYSYDGDWFIRPWQQLGQGQTTLIDYLYDSSFSNLTVCIGYTEITLYIPFQTSYTQENCIGGFPSGRAPEPGQKPAG